MPSGNVLSEKKPWIFLSNHSALLQHMPSQIMLPGEALIFSANARLCVVAAHALTNHVAQRGPEIYSKHPPLRRCSACPQISCCPEKLQPPPPGRCRSTCQARCPARNNQCTCMWVAVAGQDMRGVEASLSHLHQQRTW
eukprot:1159575-Pelagomonas_calceolata.AAC.7